MSTGGVATYNGNASPPASTLNAADIPEGSDAPVAEGEEEIEEESPGFELVTVAIALIALLIIIGRRRKA